VVAEWRCVPSHHPCPTIVIREKHLRSSQTIPHSQVRLLDCERAAQTVPKCPWEGMLGSLFTGKVPTGGNNIFDGDALTPPPEGMMPPYTTRTIPNIIITIGGK